MSDKYQGGILAGSADVSGSFMLRSTTDNTAVTGKVAADTVLSYWRQGGVRVNVADSDLAAVDSVYSSGGIKEVDSTNMPGLYRVDWPDAAFASGADWVHLAVVVSGAYVFQERFAITTNVVQTGDTYAQLPTNFIDLSITTPAGRVDVESIEGADATDQIRDAVVDDATRIDASALNTLSGHDPGANLGTSTLTQTQVTGGAYTLDTDANGRIRIVDGAGVGEINTNGGKVVGVELVDTVTTYTGNTLQTADVASLNNLSAANVETACDASLVSINLDHLLAVADADDVADDSVIGQMASTDGDWSNFAKATDSLQAVRDRGDAAWTTGAGGSDRLLMVDTTIATLATQTSFTLTAGSADNDAYNNCTIIVEDVSTATQKAVGMVLAYTGATKTVTLKEALAFTIATTDKVYILAENALKSTVANRQLDVTATGAGGIDWGNVENPTTAVDLSATDIQLVDTCTTLTGHTAQTGDTFALANGAAGFVAIDAKTTNLPGDPASETNVDATETKLDALIVTVGAAGVGLSNINLPNQTMDIVGNITGNLSGSVGSVTGAVGSVTGAVGSVTGAVGSVTGNVGGNVVGTVASVVGAVGSVAGNVDGNVTGSVGSVVGDTKQTADHTAAIAALPTAVENADGLLARNVAGGSNGGRTVKQALYRLRNKSSLVAGTLTVCDVADAGDWTAAVTTDPAADLITVVDPT